jgi:hypothetical protein
MGTGGGTAGAGRFRGWEGGTIPFEAVRSGLVRANLSPFRQRQGWERTPMEAGGPLTGECP